MYIYNIYYIYVHIYIYTQIFTYAYVYLYGYSLWATWSLINGNQTCRLLSAFSAGGFAEEQHRYYLRPTGRKFIVLLLGRAFPDPWEDPKSRSPIFSGLQYSYGVDWGTLKWICFLDPSSGLGPQGPQSTTKSPNASFWALPCGLN